jgi:MOSC domain-containing protein YiiM
VTGVLSSIQIGQPRTVVQTDRSGEAHKQRTAIYKTPALGPVMVHRLGIAGDGQANLKVHGGVDGAILAYSAEHYPRWHAELNNTEMQPGGFGENFTISSSADTPLDETTVCLGDRFTIGEIEVEVSQPRQPCATLVRRWKLAELAQMVLDLNRGGWYLRVLREGMVSTGATVTRTANPFPAWTIARAMQLMYHGDDSEKADLLNCPALSDRWKSQLRKMLHSVA